VSSAGINFVTDNSMTELEKLRVLSSSPYPPAAPRRHRLVSAIARFANRGNRAALVTPHLSGGTNEAKVEYEYKGATVFWEEIGSSFDPKSMSGKDVLDVGCGWGGKTIHFAEHLKPRSIHGFDLPGVFEATAPELVAKAKGLTNCHFTTGFAEDIPFPDAQFDILIMEDVMEHVADPEKCLSECCRVLRPGGTLIVKFPSFASMKAHHLDRAISLPGMHYILPMRAWAEGLNYLRIQPGSPYKFEPFDEVVPTKFRRAVTRNLNGIGFRSFSEAVARMPLKASTLELKPFNVSQGRKSNLKSLYGHLFRAGLMREFLACFILFVGTRTDGK
jgi:2-polyprenyl-3-methyl-5-hydroxy-6-metoxy-1,4-benzoquinol methylase